MDASTNSPKASETDEAATPPSGARPSAYEILLIFTAGWLGGSGLLALFGESDTPTRILGAGEAAAAALWFLRKFRLAGFGAMLAVLAFAMVDQLLIRQPPGALVFYAAVVVYLAAVARRNGALD